MILDVRIQTLLVPKQSIMNVEPENVRSIHKVGPIRAITIPVNLVLCIAAFFAGGPIAAILAFAGMCLLWFSYATVLPNYLVKKMDGESLLVQRGSPGFEDVATLYRKIN